MSRLTNHIAASAYVEWFLGKLEKEKVKLSAEDKDHLEKLIFTNFRKYSDPAVAALKSGKASNVIKVISEVVARIIWLEFKEYRRNKNN